MKSILLIAMLLLLFFSYGCSSNSDSGTSRQQASSGMSSNLSEKLVARGFDSSLASTIASRAQVATDSATQKKDYSARSLRMGRWTPRSSVEDISDDAGIDAVAPVFVQEVLQALDDAEVAELHDTFTTEELIDLVEATLESVTESHDDDDDELEAEEIISMYADVFATVVEELYAQGLTDAEYVTAVGSAMDAFIVALGASALENDAIVDLLDDVVEDVVVALDEANVPSTIYIQVVTELTEKAVGALDDAELTEDEMNDAILEIVKGASRDIEIYGFDDSAAEAEAFAQSLLDAVHAGLAGITTVTIDYDDIADELCDEIEIEFEDAGLSDGTITSSGLQGFDPDTDDADDSDLDSEDLASDDDIEIDDENDDDDDDDDE